VSNINSNKLHNYISSIKDDEVLLSAFISLMDKQEGGKPISLLDGLSIYKQAKSPNYSYRVNNKEWGVSERKSCKTADKEQAKNIAFDVWNRYKVMYEFKLIEKQGETFIQFAERMVIPNMQKSKDHFDAEAIEASAPQDKKQRKQKANAIGKVINHIRLKCLFLHGFNITELKSKHFEDFALSLLKDDESPISTDTFDNYMAAVRKVLASALSDGVLEIIPNTTINKTIRSRFNKKSKRKHLTDEQVSTIFQELEGRIKEHKEKVVDNNKTSKWSRGKLLKLQTYFYYLHFIKYTGVRAGDECFKITWSDFKVIEMTKNDSTKKTPDYYVTIRGGKIESKKSEGREILVSKGNEKSKIFPEVLTPLAKLQGFTGLKDAMLNAPNDFVFLNGIEATQRYIKKWGIFSVNFDPYHFRHYYITKEILKGEPLDRISKQCGNSVNEIQKTYNHATTQRYRGEELKRKGIKI